MDDFYKESNWDDADEDVYANLESEGEDPRVLEAEAASEPTQIDGLPIHRAEPIYEDEYHCKVCGQRIHLVPGGHGSVYVHMDTGTVAATNPMNGNRVTVMVDTIDLTKSKRHAGQLGLTYEDTEGEQWPGLKVTGPQDRVLRFLTSHLGGVRLAIEYLREAGVSA